MTDSPPFDPQPSDELPSDELSGDALLADDSQSSPQLWSDDVEIPAAATPVAADPPKVAPPTTRSGTVRKTKARELALQMLYQADANPETTEQDIADQLRERLPQADLFQFAWDLYRGVLRERERLDAMIEQVATNWTLQRMPTTDRNVLRLGAYELNDVDTPFGVVLDEAIDMAKKFGASQSASFVNGVLDQLVPESKRPGGSTKPLPQAVPPTESETPSEPPVDEPTPDDPPAEETIHSRASPREVARLQSGSPIAFRRQTDETTEPKTDES